jgi:hypothetical protein
MKHITLVMDMNLILQDFDSFISSKIRRLVTKSAVTLFTDFCDKAQ